jgi:uncharacterized protein (DUF302 family)
MKDSTFQIARKPLLGLLVATAIAISTPIHARAGTPVVAGSTDVTVIKESVEFAVPFDVFTQRIESMTGRYDPQDTVLAAQDYKTGLERVKASQGPEGLMLFRSDDHGALWALIGEPPRKALRYYIGNPLFAVQMTRKNIGAALYAPLSLVVYETDDGKTAAFYDRPSSLFGQFHDPDIDKVGAALDVKLRTLLAAAGKPG